MDKKTYEYILDAMNLASSELEDVGLEELNHAIKRLNKAIDKFYEWYKHNTINQLVDAVNKHADIIKQIGDWGTSKGECLWCETLTKFEPNELKRKD
jgi:hypothetical protein